MYGKTRNGFDLKFTYFVKSTVARARHSRYSCVAAQQPHQMYKQKSTIMPPLRSYFSLTLLRFQANPIVHIPQGTKQSKANKSTTHAIFPPLPSIRSLFYQ